MGIQQRLCDYSLFYFNLIPMYNQNNLFFGTKIQTIVRQSLISDLISEMRFQSAHESVHQLLSEIHSAMNRTFIVQYITTK